jgi:hypothetical protein
MKKILALFGLSLLSLVGLMGMGGSAQAQDIPGNICRASGGTYTNGSCNKPNSPGLFEDGGIIRNVINILLFVIGIIAVIMLIVGGIRYVVSGGDQNAVQGAKNTILYAIIGIVVAFLAFAAVRFVTTNLNPSS